MSEAASICDVQHVTYSHRVYDPGKGVLIPKNNLLLCRGLHTLVTVVVLADSYDWCIVPETGYDVIVLAGLAVVVACLCQGRLSNLMVLVAGQAVVVLHCQ